MVIDTSDWGLDQPLDPAILIELDATDIIAAAQGYTVDDDFVPCRFCTQDCCLVCVEVSEDTPLWPLWAGELVYVCCACHWVDPDAPRYPTRRYMSYEESAEEAA